MITSISTVADVTGGNPTNKIGNDGLFRSYSWLLLTIYALLEGSEKNILKPGEFPNLEEIYSALSKALVAYPACLYLIKANFGNISISSIIP